MCNHTVAMTDQIERRAVLPASPEAVWEAITAPDQLPQWFGADVDFDLVPGGEATFRGHDGDRRRGVVEEVDAPRRLVFRWWPLGQPLDASTVSVDLQPDGDGEDTEVVVTERRAVPATPAGGTGAEARLAVSA